MKHLLVLVIAAAGCQPVSPVGTQQNDASSGSATGNGSAQVTGSFEAMSLDGLTYALSEIETNSKGSTLQVVLVADATCGDVTTGPTANAVFLDLSLYSIDPASDSAVAPTAPGTFTLDVSSAGPYAEADVVTLDASCAQNTAATGKFESGTVTVTDMTGGVITGSFDLADSDDHASGTFTTVECVGAGSLATPTQPATNCH